MTAAEADDYRARIKSGDHPRSLRTHLRRILPGTRNGERVQGDGRPEEPTQDVSSE